MRGRTLRAPVRSDVRTVVEAFDGPAGAYVHVPFCAAVCPFCPYNKVRADAAVASRYFQALRREVSAYAAAWQDRFAAPFTSLYVGGGTPTLYPGHLAGVLAAIPVAGERAIEVLPGHATPRRLQRLRDMGFTAVSIGAQSFHDPVLRRLHRPHDAATALRAVKSARQRFACVDVDLIVDVDIESSSPVAGAFLDDVRHCFDLEVDQVSTYPLMRFGYTPFGRARHDRRREHAVLAEVGELAARCGYERRSVWTFNRIGRPAYTSITRPRYLGFGAGSSSFAGRDFFVNHFGVATYVRSVEEGGGSAVARRLRLGRWGGAAYDAFWQAYAGGVDLSALRRCYGSSVAAVARVALAAPSASGLLRPCPGGYRLTPRGFDVYHDLERAVTYQLIEPLWAEMLTEHVAEGATVRTDPDHPAPAEWVRPAAGRRARAWWLVRRLTERPAA